MLLRQADVYKMRMNRLPAAERPAGRNGKRTNEGEDITMKKFFSEFKDFIAKGNVLDMAVGIIIGAAFKTIVDSLVGDIISPLLGLIVNTDFSNLVLSIGDVPIRYGSFITAILNFLIMAFVLFLIIKTVNSARTFSEKLIHTAEGEQAEEAAPTTKECPYCKSTIVISATRCPNCTSQLDK